jgi:hypothetical protein
MSTPFDDQEKSSGSAPVSLNKLESPTSNTSPSSHAIDEQKLVRKVDWRVVPGVVLLYLLSFLDRSNVANAKIEGLAEDLHMSMSEDIKAVSLLIVM